jgi:simple sugar transport system substrate-binding protein
MMVRRAVLGLVVCAAAACSARVDDQTPPPRSREVVVVVPVLGVSWFDRLATGVADAGDRLEITASMVGPTDHGPPDEQRAAEQIAIIEGLIDRGVGAVAVVPSDPVALDPTLARAQSESMVVLTNDSPAQEHADWNVESYIEEHLAERIFGRTAELMGGQGQYAVFVSAGGEAQQRWFEHGKAYLEREYGDALQLVSHLEVEAIPCANDAQACADATEQLLAQFPALGGIIGLGSQGPMGAGLKLEELDRGDIAVVGIALPFPASELLGDEYIDEVVIWDPRDVGFALVAVAQRLLDGETDLAANNVFPDLGAAFVDVEQREIAFDRLLILGPEDAQPPPDL